MRAHRIEAVADVKSDRVGRIVCACVRRRALKRDFNETDLGVGREQARGDPAPIGVDDLGAIGNAHIGSDRDDIAVPHQDGAVGENALIA